MHPHGARVHAACSKAWAASSKSQTGSVAHAQHDDAEEAEHGVR